MLDIREIIETRQMVSEDSLDVRTITLGINLMDCAADSVNKLCDNTKK